MFNRFFVVICVIYISAWSSLAYAISQVNIESQKEIFQRLEKNQQQDILYFDVQKPTLETSDGQRCIQINQVNDQTLTLLSQQEKDKLINPFKDSCRTITDINNLVKQLSALYIDKGYVTSKVYLKPQAIKDGTLELYAIEGKIDNITPNNEFYINNAFLGLRGDYLNLRDLERSIEVINNLSSNQATMQLAPGKEVGTTDVQIKNISTNRVHGTLNLDNFGDETTGEYQGSATVYIDNPLEQNDKLTLSINSTDNNNDIENSKGRGFQYNLPIGNRFSTNFKYRKTTYEQLINAGTTDYDSHGDTSTYVLDLSYKAFHNKNHRVNIGSSVTHYKANNFIGGALIDTSSYNISKAAGNINYLYQTTGFYVFVEFGLTKGTNWFNDHNPTDLDERFLLYTGDLSIMKQFSSFQYQLSAYYQYAQDPLFSTDQISIGGPYSVRGYNDEGLEGNTGYYARHEVTKSLEVKLFDEIEQSYFIALDHGHIKRENDVDGGTLIGSAIGAKYTYKDFSLQTYYSVPLRDDDVTQTSNFWGITASYNF